MAKKNALKNRIERWFKPTEIFTVEKRLFKNENEAFYLMITHNFKYKPCKIYLNELLENKEIMDKLDKESYAYIMMIGTTFKLFFSDDYILATCNILNKTITVKNVKTLVAEDWDYDTFKTKYLGLDKNSIFQIALFFNATINKNPDNENITDNYTHLTLIK